MEDVGSIPKLTHLGFTSSYSAFVWYISFRSELESSRVKHLGMCDLTNWTVWYRLEGLMIWAFI